MPPLMLLLVGGPCSESLILPGIDRMPTQLARVNVRPQSADPQHVGLRQRDITLIPQYVETARCSVAREYQLPIVDEHVIHPGSGNSIRRGGNERCHFSGLEWIAYVVDPKPSAEPSGNHSVLKPQAARLDFVFVDIVGTDPSALQMSSGTSGVH